MEKATVIVDVEQPLVQNNKTQTITNPSETITINPDEGYDALKKVTVTTNIPLQNNKTQTITNPNETVTITPDTGYEALKQVTVTTNVPIPELETWTNKRFISTGTINVGNVMNDNTKAGISKQSTFVIDVPTPSITQISNYPVTTTGTVNVPIPSGYDAVDSISLSVNISSKIKLNGFRLVSSSRPFNSFSNMTYMGTDMDISVPGSKSILIIYKNYAPNMHQVYYRANNKSSAVNVTVNAYRWYYIGDVGNNCYLGYNNTNILNVYDSQSTDNYADIVYLNASYFEFEDLNRP